MLFQLYAKQVIRFRAAQVGCVDAPGEFPLAAPLARAQAAAGDPLIATLHQIAAPMEDSTFRELLQRLDGTRDRERLALDLASLSGIAAEEAPAMVSEALMKFARAGLLMG